MSDMSGFKQYRHKQIAELREYVRDEVLSDRVSVSAADQEAGSPKLGDMIARNPKNHADQWLVAAAYFADNFEPCKRTLGVVRAGMHEVQIVVRRYGDMQFHTVYDERIHGIEFLRGEHALDALLRALTVLRGLTDHSALEAMLTGVVPIEHCGGGLLTLRCDDGTRLSFLCGPTGRLNGVTIQHGPNTPELRLPSRKHEGS